MEQEQLNRLQRNVEEERKAETARIEEQKKRVDEERAKVAALRVEREASLREERRLRQLAGQTLLGGGDGDAAALGRYDDRGFEIPPT